MFGFLDFIIMQEVWQFVSTNNRLISVLLFNFSSKINWKWFVFVVRSQKLYFFLFRVCSSVVLIVSLKICIIMLIMRLVTS